VITEDAFSYRMTHSLDDSFLDMSVDALLGEMKSFNSSQRAILVFILQYLVASDYSLWNVLYSSIDLSAALWSTEDDLFRSALDLVNMMLSVTVKEEQVDQLKQLQNRILCTI